VAVLLSAVSSIVRALFGAEQESACGSGARIVTKALERGGPNVDPIPREDRIDSGPLAIATG
jgi:hypothetical protein